MPYKPTSTSWIEISKSAIQNNVDFIKKLIGEKTIFSAVVKGNAYGHDISKYAQLAYDCGVQHFSVYAAHEAELLLESVKGDFDIMILGSLSQNEMEWAIEHGLEFYVINFESLENAILSSKKKKQKAKIHIEFETGMNRTGFAAETLSKVLEILKNNAENLVLKGVCTHLAGAESITNYKRIKDQIKVFKKIKSIFRKQENWKPMFHIACSAAVLRYPKYQFDLVRVGILQYGFFPNNETHMHYILQNKEDTNPLNRVISWKTKIVDIKTVGPGEFIGYGTSFYTNNETVRIAIIPVGYGFGYSRSLSNQGKVLINGSRQDVIGTINMNMMTVDISAIPDAKIGDEVVLIGKQGDQEITVSSFSEFSTQLNYELLTRLPMDIERKVVD